jgi:DNA-binding HxlR family transcriptional regulator
LSDDNEKWQQQSEEVKDSEIQLNGIGLSIYDKKKMKRNPINNTFNLIGKSFTIMILHMMMNSKDVRFNQILETVEGIGPKTLSKRLKEMEKNGLIERAIFDERPVRIVYNLTEKGNATKPILEQMAIFSIKYCSKDIFQDI